MHRRLKVGDWERCNHFAIVMVQNILISKKNGFKLFSDMFLLSIRQMSKPKRDMVTAILNTTKPFWFLSHSHIRILNQIHKPLLQCRGRIRGLRNRSKTFHMLEKRVLGHRLQSTILNYMFYRQLGNLLSYKYFMFLYCAINDVMVSRYLTALCHVSSLYVSNQN